jgi:hypothetical protein
MRKANCVKCNKYDYVEDHHILPVSTFGKNDEKATLCSNCHTEYHQLLGKEGLKNPSAQFHFEKYLKWLFGVGVLALLVWLVL